MNSSSVKNPIFRLGRVDFGVHDNGDGTWQWAYYPKSGQEIVQSGQVKGNREAAMAAAKAAIDKWLGPSN